jgi:hypothetical protein
VQIGTSIPDILAAKDLHQEAPVKASRLKRMELAVIIGLFEIVEVKARGDQAVSLLALGGIVFEERRKTLFRGQDGPVVK